MDQILERYPFPEDLKNIDLSGIIESSKQYKNDIEVLNLLFNCIDLTSLNTTDSSYGITDFVEKVNKFKSVYPDVPNVAAICVYPAFAPVLKGSLKAKGVNKAVVSAGFPASQTFTDIKKLETQKAIDFEVDEVDIVISVGEFLEGNYEFVGEEIVLIKEVMGNAHLKVILETGALESAENIWIASLLAIECGADFIKTSTGKIQPAATPEAAYIMCRAIKTYNEKKQKKIGFKPAGGISTASDALIYYNIVKELLGNDWLNNKLFRIGASSLANNLLSDIIDLKNIQGVEKKYF